MRLLEGLAELFAPTRCAGCELPGALLCADCLERALRFPVEQSCPRCGAPFGALVCTECWSISFAFEKAVALGELASPLARAVVLHKDGGEQRLGAELGTLLGRAVLDRWGGWPDDVTWVPPTDKALRRRGFDHGRAIAEAVACVLGCSAVELLSRERALDQRSLGRAERALNASGTFSVIRAPRARVLVVDDVLTTGATLDAAAEVLLAAGAQAVRAAVVARAW